MWSFSFDLILRWLPQFNIANPTRVPEETRDRCRPEAASSLHLSVLICVEIDCSLLIQRSLEAYDYSRLLLLRILAPVPH